MPAAAGLETLQAKKWAVRFSFPPSMLRGNFGGGFEFGGCFALLAVTHKEQSRIQSRRYHFGFKHGLSGHRAVQILVRVVCLPNLIFITFMMSSFGNVNMCSNVAQSAKPLGI